jgi:hypothetical protein
MLASASLVSNAVDVYVDGAVNSLAVGILSECPVGIKLKLVIVRVDGALFQNTHEKSKNNAPDETTTMTLRHLAFKLFVVNISHVTHHADFSDNN